MRIMKHPIIKKNPKKKKKKPSDSNEENGQKSESGEKISKKKKHRESNNDIDDDQLEEDFIFEMPNAKKNARRGIIALPGIHPMTGEREVYFIGIIDCLTEFLLGKKNCKLFQKNYMGTRDSFYCQI